MLLQSILVVAGLLILQTGIKFMNTTMILKNTGLEQVNPSILINSCVYNTKKIFKGVKHLHRKKYCQGITEICGVKYTLDTFK